jgi:hypothetical protein
MDWRCGSSGKALHCEQKALSSNPNPTKINPQQGVSSYVEYRPNKNMYSQPHMEVCIIMYHSSGKGTISRHISL